MLRTEVTYKQALSDDIWLDFMFLLRLLLFPFQLPSSKL